MIRVVLPQHLRTLAQVSKEVELQVEGSMTLGSVLDALEISASYVARNNPRSHHKTAPTLYSVLRLRRRLVA